jgi:hypothetical protein
VSGRATLEVVGRLLDEALALATALEEERLLDGVLALALEEAVRLLPALGADARRFLGDGAMVQGPAAQPKVAKKNGKLVGREEEEGQQIIQSKNCEHENEKKMKKILGVVGGRSFDPPAIVVAF